jgi:archaellum biogenesis ATPase FlaH
VEGRRATGKSVLCHHLVHHTLKAGLGVAYYASGEPSPSLLTRCAGLGLDMMDHFLLDRLRIYTLEPGDESLGPSPWLDRLAQHLETLPPQFVLVVVDTISTLMPHASRQPLLTFLEDCRHVCSQGRATVLALDTGPGLDWALGRMSAEPDTHVRLSLAEVVDGRVLRVMDVERRDQHPEWPSPQVAFQVRAGVGIQVVPWRRFRLPPDSLWDLEGATRPHPPLSQS